MNRSITAMMQRGFDSRTAAELAKQKYTLAKLSKLRASEIAALDLPQSAISALRHLKRPPIPEPTLLKILHDSARTCCICRKSSRGVIVHHIKPWEKSRSHNPKNLAVLCLLCHGEAHTTRELSRNLTQSDILYGKRKWEAVVRNRETRAILKTSSTSLLGSVWDYFNHRRLAQLAENLELEVSTPRDGTIGLVLRELNYRYEGRGHDAEYAQYKLLLETLCQEQGVTNLTSIWSVSELLAVPTPRCIVSINALIRFKSIHKAMTAGPGQTRMGYHQANGIRIEFTFDAWEATSNSSWASTLRGGTVATAICMLESVERSEKLLKLNARVLAIGTGLGNDPPKATPKVAYTHGNYR